MLEQLSVILDRFHTQDLLGAKDAEELACSRRSEAASESQRRPDAEGKRVSEAQDAY